MQILQLTFMALLLAHLLADFPLQSNWIVRNKGGQFAALACHGIMHWALAWICLVLFASANFLSWHAQFFIAGYLLAHLAIDKLKYWLIQKQAWGDEAMTFSVDQGMHLLTIVIVTFALHGRTPQALWSALEPSVSTRMHFLEIATVYLGVVACGGYLIRNVTKSFRTTICDENNSGNLTNEPELKNAGLYIGYLERLLILTAILAKSATLVGLILTGKSIARFPEFKKPSFAEYFLIGTLLSVFLAVLGGLLLQKMLYGSIEFR